jgi:hypothetical protein
MGLFILTRPSAVSAIRALGIVLCRGVRHVRESPERVDSDERGTAQRRIREVGPVASSQECDERIVRRHGCGACSWQEPDEVRVGRRRWCRTGHNIPIWTRKRGVSRREKNAKPRKEEKL